MQRKMTERSWKTRRIARIIKRVTLPLFVLVLFFQGMSIPAYAEVDPVILGNILSQLAGTGVAISTNSTGSNSTGSSSTGSVVTPLRLSWSTNVTVSGAITVTPTKVIVPNKTVIPNVKPTEVEPIETTPPKIEPIPEKIIPYTPSSATPSFKIVKVEIGDKKATFTFRVLNETPDIRKFQFLYADAEGRGDKVLTFEKERIKKANGDYAWYIPGLTLTKYTVSIAWVGADGETLSRVVSQPFEADLSLASAGKCIIPNVSGLRVLPKRDMSVLYWDSIPEAVSYKVYKKNMQGEYVFLEETKQDSYTIQIADGSVKYEQFSIKAVCSDGTESVQFAPSTNVRTGPSEFILLVLISAVIGFMIVQKRKKILWRI